MVAACQRYEQLSFSGQLRTQLASSQLMCAVFCYGCDYCSMPNGLWNTLFLVGQVAMNGWLPRKQKQTKEETWICYDCQQQERVAIIQEKYPGGTANARRRTSFTCLLHLTSIEEATSVKRNLLTQASQLNLELQLLLSRLMMIILSSLFNRALLVSFAWRNTINTLTTAKLAYEHCCNIELARQRARDRRANSQHHCFLLKQQGCTQATSYSCRTSQQRCLKYSCFRFYHTIAVINRMPLNLATQQLLPKQHIEKTTQLLTTYSFSLSRIHHCFSVEVPNK